MLFNSKYMYITDKIDAFKHLTDKSDALRTSNLSII